MKPNAVSETPEAGLVRGLCPGDEEAAELAIEWVNRLPVDQRRHHADGVFRDFGPASALTSA